MNRALILAGLLVAAIAAPVLAKDAETERRIEAQDRLDPKKDRVRLLNDARAAVEEADTARNRYLLGRAYGIAGEFDKAREQFDWAIERDPGFAYSYLGLGIYHLMKGNAEEAERQLGAALRLDPKLDRARVDLGKIYLDRGERISAEREFQEVLANDPGNSEVRLLLSFMYLREKRYSKAIEELRIVLSKDPDQLRARKMYAIALALTKQVEGAIREFERVLEKMPKDLECYAFLKNLHLDRGDRDAAVKILERLLAELPEEHPLRVETQAEIERIRAGRPPPGRAPTVDDLIARLDSDDVEVRREAMRTLSELEYWVLPSRMVRAVRDPDLVVRTLAVKKIASTSPAQSVPLLEILLLHDSDRDAESAVRAAAARGIAKSGSDAAPPILLAALGDESFDVFRVAVEGLREITGVVLDGEWNEPPSPSRREEIAAAWREWWAGPRAFARRIRAVEGLVALDFPRGRRYVAEMIDDAETMVAERAFDGFVTMTGRKPGDRAALATPEGRAKVAAAALAALEGK